MKLIYCNECRDMVKLRRHWQPRTCLCGKSGGFYNEDGDTATVWGPSKVVGLSNLIHVDGRADAWWYDESNGKITRLVGAPDGKAYPKEMQVQEK